MPKDLLLAALLVLHISAIAQDQPSKAPAAGSKIGASAVWQMPPTFLSSAHAACDKSAQPRSFGECFIAQMPKAGAPAAAVAFTKMLYGQNGGDVGIMSGFNAVGPVDVAWIVYPLRANTNNGLLLVNGSPTIVNAEDLKLLDQAGMQQSFQFQDLKGQFPNVGVWPGDRDGTTWPNTQQGPNNGLQFILGYPLINGCHACAHAGTALFTWNFDAHGKFLGTTFLGLTPAPLPGGNAGAASPALDNHRAAAPGSHTPAAATPS
jgi:hypothetical protein